ncbi:MAG: 50S ribosomal protein L28 [Holosporales bacterium]|jgi:large subunit ribosomal protein L28|nr:50S ribosomal protein L28 [Holosporales bacterium]
MARRCELTGKAVQYGCNVSHANNKSSRRFLPNLQNVSFLSDSLRCTVSLRVATNGIRCVEASGGLDSYLRKTCDSKLSRKAIAIKKVLKSKVEK